MDRIEPRWRVERPISDVLDFGLAQKATTMKSSSEPSDHWCGQQRMLSVQGDWMSGSYMSPSAIATSTLNARRGDPYSPPDHKIIRRQRLGGKAKQHTARRERDEAHERAAKTIKQKARQHPPSLMTVIKYFKKGGPYWGFHSKLARVGHYWPFSFRSILVLTNTIRTWRIALATP